jgi:hypothetical protein
MWIRGDEGDEVYDRRYWQIPWEVDKGDEGDRVYDRRSGHHKREAIHLIPGIAWEVDKVDEGDEVYDRRSGTINAKQST